MKAIALGEVVDIVMGQAPPGKASNFSGIGTPFVKVGEFGPLRPVIREWTTQPLKMARRSDVLLCVVGATCGKINLGEDCAIGRSVAAIRPKEDVLDQQYLYYFLSTLVLILRSGSQGAAQTVISKEMIQAVNIPLPPITEQQRIVAILDEAFAKLAMATANVEKNIKNAHELYESVLSSTFAEGDKNWIETSLGEACEMYQPKTISARDLVKNGKYPVYGANGVIGRYDKFNHEDAQLLITCRGATCGAVNVSLPKSWITGNAMVVRPKTMDIDLKFLEFAFRGGIDISRAITGAAQPQITRTNLSPILLRHPKSVDEQRKLSVVFHSLHLKSIKLGEIYRSKLKSLGDLRQSFLQKAFAGELTSPPSRAIHEAAE